RRRVRNWSVRLRLAPGRGCGQRHQQSQYEKFEHEDETRSRLAVMIHRGDLAAHSPISLRSADSGGSAMKMDDCGRLKVFHARSFRRLTADQSSVTSPGFTGGRRPTKTSRSLSDCPGSCGPPGARYHPWYAGYTFPCGPVAGL